MTDPSHHNQQNDLLRPPPPSAQALHLVSALSNPEPAEVHRQALQARDDAFSSSSESYGNLCVQLAFCLVGCDNAAEMLLRMNPADLQAWQLQDATAVAKLQHTPTLWIPFGQTAGLILKNALLRPPAGKQTPTIALVEGPVAEQVRQTLLFALTCQHAELRAVASTVIATTAVSPRLIQPVLHVSQWKALVPTLVGYLVPHNPQSPPSRQPIYPLQAVEGALATIQKIMEDGPGQLDQEELDQLVPVLLQYLQRQVSGETTKLMALQSFVAMLAMPILPSALIRYFDDYMTQLSNLATDTNNGSAVVRQWVCRSIVSLLQHRTEYLDPSRWPSVAQFMLQATMSVRPVPNAQQHHQHQQQGAVTNNVVALEACEFWLSFATLDEAALRPDMMEYGATLLPQLIPALLQNMVYSEEERVEIVAQNELDEMGNSTVQSMKPIFHRSRANKHSGGGPSGSGHDDDDEDVDDDDGYDQDDEEDDEDEFEDGGAEWTLRKCAAASLDALANLYGSEPILPSLLPSLETGLSHTDPWVQEASILALGAVAEGCREAMEGHMGQLHPYLLNHLAAVQVPIPQVKSIAAWTLGRYASWVVEQVQAGTQGHLLAQCIEVFMNQLGATSNRRVQVAICSALGALVESAGDLCTPYLEHMYRPLTTALSVFQGRPLLLVLDVLGTMADYCGPSIAEGNLPVLYIPPMMEMWDRLAKKDPTDKTLLPLMESLASIAVTTGTSFQPFALEAFENAMAIIEAVQLIMVSTGDGFESEDEADPIICALDLLDGLVEGMSANFGILVRTSQRFGQHFLSVVHTMCRHEIAGVRMSAFALVGDLARNSPALLEPGLSQIIQEALQNMDPIQPQVCTNAVWSMGEICVCCRGHAAVLEPHAATLMQNLIALLVGNGGAGGSDIPGLPENSAACAGRLAQVNPTFVAPELPRFLFGWCSGLAKIADPTERRDAFQGLVQAVYANPGAIQQAAVNVSDAISSILFAIVSWHIPSDYMERSDVLLKGDYNFQPFPASESELGLALQRLVQDMKTSVGPESWYSVQKALPVNVRQLLRECYNL